MYPPDYPAEWRFEPQIRVLVTATENTPAQVAWEAGALAPNTPEALRIAQALAEESYAAGRVEWVWVGHNGPYAPGVWKWWTRIGPPGWESDFDAHLRELEQERAQRAQEAQAAAYAAKLERNRLRREGKIVKLDATDAIVTASPGSYTAAAVSPNGLELDEDGNEVPF